MTLQSDTVIVKNLLSALFSSILDNDRAKAVIDGFFPGAFSGVILSKQYRIKAGVETLAGVGAGADTDGTERTYNVGTALPAGAILQGYMVDLDTAFTGNATLDLQIGVTADVDSIMDACDLMGTPGHTQGTPGTLFTGVLPSAPQILATVTPDVASKVSEAVAGEVLITVFYVDAT